MKPLVKLIGMQLSRCIKSVSNPEPVVRWLSNDLETQRSGVGLKKYGGMRASKAINLPHNPYR